MTPFCVLIAFALTASPPASPEPATADGPAVRDLVFLADNRPVFLRLRVTIGERPVDAAWADSIKTLHSALDRDGNGTLTTKEADKDIVAAIVRLGTGDGTVLPLGELDSRPKDSVVSLEELADALRPSLGPFHVKIDRQSSGRTDALFGHLDRDKDGQLTRSELAAIAGSLRPLDLDDNGMISADELEPFTNPAVNARVEVSSERRARFTAVPPVVELVAGESSLRIARLLLKKYDKGRDDGSGRPDNKLSPSEFAIERQSFEDADSNHDEALDTEELRRFLAHGPNDLELDVTFPADATGHATVRFRGGKDLPKGTQARQLAEGDVEYAVGRIRLDVHIDDGEVAAANARRVLSRRFEVADANKDGYLEGKELAGESAPGAPLLGLVGLADRDGDGKLYLKELLDFVDRQNEAARGRSVLRLSDQGRAIFGVLDLDRDRRLGAREVMKTVDRVTSWDEDGDNRVTADEIPYHFQIKITRGELSGLIGGGNVAVAGPRSMVAQNPAPSAAGPVWFRKMDRNRDRDVSRREFLGTRDQFEALDRDKDGLIDLDEATVDPTAKENKKASGDGDRP